MMKNLPKQLILVIALTIYSLSGIAQNWQYVGAPYINGTTGSSTYLYYPDLEINSSGEVFVGYWEYIGKLHFAKYSGGSWTQLPTIGTFTANSVDIEVQGSNYYMAYSRVRGSNMYAFVQKYNGSIWTQVGDSLLLGNSGSGGYFDFALDNAGVPTVVGTVTTPLLGNKQMVQYNGSAWTVVHTFTNSAATVFRENTCLFNSLNKFYCTTQGYIMTSGLKYYTVVHKIDGGVRSTVGDTIWRQLGAHKLKLDASDVPHLFSYGPVSTKIYPFKLNGSNWSFIGDTISPNIGTPLSADLANNGNFVFNAQTTNLFKSVFYYSSGTRNLMDTLNINGFAVGSVNDVIVTPASGDVYVVMLEIKPGAVQDISVMKHAAPGTIGVNELILSDNLVGVFPNPCNGRFTINQKFDKDAQVKIYNLAGQLIYDVDQYASGQVIDISSLPKGLYLINISLDNKVYNSKVAIE